MSTAERNWAGNHVYQATRVERPTTIEQVQHVVATSDRVRALGSRHSFTDLPDTDGVLVSLADVPPTVEVDEVARTAHVTGFAAYGDVARALEARAWALGNLASLPHISVAGAIATGTHGSGDGNGSLATAVAALDIVGAGGELRRVARGDDDFSGSVVSLGALGVVVGVTLDIEPTFAVSQTVFTGLGWEAFAANVDAVTGSAYSVSLFTHWGDDGFFQVWCKSRGETGPTAMFGATPATRTLHMLDGGPTEAVSAQLGRPGPWLDRLAHFRMDFTPSRGAELQSEYLLPRPALLTAVEHLRELGPRLGTVLQSSELRTVAADELWLSSSYGHDVVGIHFTWVRDTEAVYALLPVIEQVLLPLGARPHWGKCFVTSAADLAELFPRLGDFARLRDRLDPQRTFDNAFMTRVLGR